LHREFYRQPLTQSILTYPKTPYENFYPYAQAIMAFHHVHLDFTHFDNDLKMTHVAMSLPLVV